LRARRARRVLHGPRRPAHGPGRFLRAQMPSPAAPRPAAPRPGRRPAARAPRTATVPAPRGRCRTRLPQGRSALCWAQACRVRPRSATQAPPIRPRPATQALPRARRPVACVRHVHGRICPHHCRRQRSWRRCPDQGPGLKCWQLPAQRGRPAPAALRWARCGRPPRLGSHGRRARVQKAAVHSQHSPASPARRPRSWLAASRAPMPDRAWGQQTKRAAQRWAPRCFGCMAGPHWAFLEHRGHNPHQQMRSARACPAPAGKRWRAGHLDQGARQRSACWPALPALRAPSPDPHPSHRRPPTSRPCHGGPASCSAPAAALPPCLQPRSRAKHKPQTASRVSKELPGLYSGWACCPADFLNSPEPPVCHVREPQIVAGAMLPSLQCRTGQAVAWQGRPRSCKSLLSTLPVRRRVRLQYHVCCQQRTILRSQC